MAGQALWNNGEKEEMQRVTTCHVHKRVSFILGDLLQATGESLYRFSRCNNNKYGSRGEKAAGRSN
jgi:hypothetical protein